MSTIVYRGRPIEYELQGEGSQPPLVLSTGTGGSFKGWLPLQAAELSQNRRLLLYNHRGVGASEDDGQRFTTGDLADDLVGLLDALSLPEVDLLGAFMGGMAAQELALTHPSRVRRLILTGTYARADAKRRMLLDHWASFAARDGSMETMARERMLWSLQDDTLAQTDLIEGMMEHLTRRGIPFTADLFARQCQACMEHDTYDRLPALDQPTLVISGRLDQLTPPKFHRELAEEMPNARLTTLRYAAHLVMVEAAERFNELVLNFLDEA
jgi:pimeloyl-ACP methyl ester carboxylesterase